MDQSQNIDLSSVINPFNDHNDISYRILAKTSNSSSDWSPANFNDISAYNDWSLNISPLKLLVHPKYDTFVEQSNNWLNDEIQLQLEAYSSSSSGISAIYTIRLQVNSANAPSWTTNSGIQDISQGESFTFDASISIYLLLVFINDLK